MVQEISFTDNSQHYCICFIGIVDSTRNTVIIDAEKMKRYYSVFINMMAAIARDFNSNIIKNTGDSIIFYFPETSDSANISARIANVILVYLILIKSVPSPLAF